MIRRRLALAVLAISGQWAIAAGPRVGNGGGGWSCQVGQRESWIEIADLMQDGPGALMPAPASTGPEIFAWARREIKHLSPELDALIRKYAPGDWSALQRVVVVTDDPRWFADIDDGDYSDRPSPIHCPGGFIRYRQIGDYQNGGPLYLRKAIWAEASFDELNRGALLVHEVVYKSLRDGRDEANSSRTRLIVRILFSDLRRAQKAQLIKILLAERAVRESDNREHLDSEYLYCTAWINNIDQTRGSATFVLRPMAAGLNYQVGGVRFSAEPVPNEIGSTRLSIETPFKKQTYDSTLDELVSETVIYLALPGGEARMNCAVESTAPAP